MCRALIGRTVRRLRTERGLSQQALATRLGISASYLNLIEHDQRAVTASLLIKLAETLRVELAELSGTEERQLEVGLREVFADPLLGVEAVPEAGDRRGREQQSQRGPRHPGAISGLAGRARGCGRHRAAIRAAHPAAERGGPRPVQRARQPLSDARGRGRGDRRRSRRDPSGDQSRDRRTAAAHTRPDGDRSAARGRASPLRSGEPYACPVRDAPAREPGLSDGLPARAVGGARAGRGGDPGGRSVLARSRRAHPRGIAQLRRRRAC